MLTLLPPFQSPSVSFSLFQSHSVSPDKGKDKDKMKAFETPNVCYIFEKIQGFPIWHFPQKIVHPPAPTHNLQEDEDRYDDDDVQMVLYAVRAMPASLLSAQVSQVGGEQGWL